jgi:hypothetical protein
MFKINSVILVNTYTNLSLNLSQSPSLKIAELETKLTLLFFSLFLVLPKILLIVNYSPTTYGAGNQNWMIAQEIKNQILQTMRIT